MPNHIPFQAVFLSRDDHAELRRTSAVPTYLFPEDAARALGKVAAYVRWREHPAASAATPQAIRTDEATAIVSEALGAEREWLDAGSCARLLDCYGIATPATRWAAGAEAAGRAAEELGGRVALKATGEGLTHKTELGAVRIGLAGGKQVSGAAREIDAVLADRGLAREGFEIQAMVEDGVELLIGIAADPVFGPIIACGAGGTVVELLGDVQLRISPLDAEDPEEMLNGLALRPLLNGFRGAPGVDIGSLEDLIARVGAMAAAHPEVAELDLNPVIATADGAVAVDCRARVESQSPDRPWPRTWA